MKKIALFFLSWILGIQSFCQEPLIIDLPKLITCTQEPKLSYFTDEITYVKLETNEDCLIGRIGQVKRVNDKLVILDLSTHKILVFSDKGKFLNQIGRKGKGPGEYLDIRNGFAIDPLTNDVIIVNKARKVLIRYRLDGEFLGEIKLDNYTTKLGFIGNNLICYTSSALAEIGRKSHLITVLDRDGNKLGDFHKSKNLYYNPVDFRVISYQHNGAFRYWEKPFSDVYEFDGKVVKKAITFEFGGDKMPEEMFYNQKKYTTKQIDYLRLFGFCEFENLIQLNIGPKRKYIEQYIFYFPKSGKAYISSYNKQFKSWGMTDDLNGGPLFTMNVRLSDDEVCSPLEYVDYVSYKESGLMETQEFKSKKGRDMLIEIMNSTSITDNPILQIIKLK